MPPDCLEPANPASVHTRLSSRDCQGKVFTTWFLIWCDRKIFGILIRPHYCYQSMPGQIFISVATESGRAKINSDNFHSIPYNLMHQFLKIVRISHHCHVARTYVTRTRTFGLMDILSGVRTAQTPTVVFWHVFGTSCLSSKYGRRHWCVR